MDSFFSWITPTKPVGMILCNSQCTGYIIHSKLLKAHCRVGLSVNNDSKITTTTKKKSVFYYRLGLPFKSLRSKINIFFKFLKKVSFAHWGCFYLKQFYIKMYIINYNYNLKWLFMSVPIVGSAPTYSVAALQASRDVDLLLET